MPLGATTTMMLAATLVAGSVQAPAEAPEAPLRFAPGIGYTVSQDLRTVVPPESARAEPSKAGFRFAPHLPPPSSDLVRVQTSPRVRGIMAAAAVATQLAMIIAGAVAVRDQNRRAREERRGEAPPYKPYR